MARVMCGHYEGCVTVGCEDLCAKLMLEGCDVVQRGWDHQRGVGLVAIGDEKTSLTESEVNPAVSHALSEIQDQQSSSRPRRVKVHTCAALILFSGADSSHQELPANTVVGFSLSDVVYGAAERFAGAW